MIIVFSSRLWAIRLDIKNSQLNGNLSQSRLSNLLISMRSHLISYSKTAEEEEELAKKKIK